MSYWKSKLMKFIKIYNLIFLIFVSFSFNAYSKNFIIQGNQFTDDKILLSIIDELPNTDQKSQSDYILKKLVNSGFFKSTPLTQKPSFLSLVTRCDPMNPPAPKTTAFFILQIISQV